MPPIDLDKDSVESGEHQAKQGGSDSTDKPKEEDTTKQPGQTMRALAEANAEAKGTDTKNVDEDYRERQRPTSHNDEARNTCNVKLEALRLELHHGRDANGVTRQREDMWREVADTLAEYVNATGTTEIAQKYNECRSEMWHESLRFQG